MVIWVDVVCVLCNLCYCFWFEYLVIVVVYLFIIGLFLLGFILVGIGDELY